ncbi:MAG TPA: N-acetyltransferase [Sphingomicrobium sp.]|nr:N-acetyltransferase [Sphingomicrobium sp.]
MEIRDERPADLPAISRLITEAFESAPHSSGSEAAIVERLREAGALRISLVASEADAIIGHVAISPVTIAGSTEWFGLGPVSVHPDSQRTGVGSALIRAALERLKRGGANGCLVVGEPDYYRRFGFTQLAAITYGEIPPAYLQAIRFAGAPPRGEVRYHLAFDA